MRCAYTVLELVYLPWLLNVGFMVKQYNKNIIFIKAGSAYYTSQGTSAQARHPEWNLRNTLSFLQLDRTLQQHGHHRDGWIHHLLRHGDVHDARQRTPILLHEHLCR